MMRDVAKSMVGFSRAVALFSLPPKTVVDVMDPRRVVQAGVDFVQRSVETIRQGGEPAPAADASPASARS